MFEHTWRGLHKHCCTCRPLTPLFPRVLGWYHYGWCAVCNSAQTCQCPWWRAPWSAFLRKLKGALYVWPTGPASRT
jgi:hypothetical protein